MRTKAILFSLVFGALDLVTAQQSASYILATVGDRVPKSLMETVCSALQPVAACSRIWTSGAKVESTQGLKGVIEKLRLIRSDRDDLDSVRGVTWSVAGDDPTRPDAVKIEHVTSESDFSSFTVSAPIEPFFEFETVSITREQAFAATKKQLNLPYHLTKLTSGFADESTATMEFVGGGNNVLVYVVDGSVADHLEFLEMGVKKTRVKGGHSSRKAAAQTEPCAGDHGTHVASLVAGLTFGVAKNATVRPVSIMPGCGEAGSISDLHEGLMWILDEYESYPKPRPPSVVTMSLLLNKGSTAAVLVEDALSHMVDAGMIVMAAAGNYASDACDFIPAGSNSIITVGAMQKDEQWTWSNFGECVDVWAQGADILGAGTACPKCTAVYSGTSQATPVVTGLIGLYLEKHPTANQTQVREWILTQASTTDDTGRRIARLV